METAQVDTWDGEKGRGPTLGTRVKIAVSSVAKPFLEGVGAGTETEA